MEEDVFEIAQKQKVMILYPNKKFELVPTSHIRLEKFTIIKDDPQYIGQRLIILADVTTTTLDKRKINLNVAIASMIIGKEYEQNLDLILSPVDHCILTIQGPPLPIQILFTEF